MESLSHRTDIELITAYREGGDPVHREQLVMRHSGLVRSIARRYHGRGLPLEDIEQTGYVGLIQAVDRYDPSRGVPLRAYAARTIGITDVPFLCAGEIDVPGAMPRVIRLMAHVEADFGRADARHVYLRGAAALRTDLPRD